MVSPIRNKNRLDVSSTDYYFARTIIVTPNNTDLSQYFIAGIEISDKADQTFGYS